MYNTCCSSYIAHNQLIRDFFVGGLGMCVLMLFVAGIVALGILSPSYGDVILYNSSLKDQTPYVQNL